MHPVDPPESQRMRGDFHHYMRDAIVQHVIKDLLEVDGFRCGHRGRDFFAGPPVGKRPEHPRIMPRAPENAFDKQRGGGLAVRTGNADQVELRGRVIVKVG